MNSTTCALFVVVLTTLLAAQGTVGSRPHKHYEDEIPFVASNVRLEGSNQVLKALCARCKQAAALVLTGTDRAVEIAEAQQIIKRFCRIFTFGLRTDSCTSTALTALKSAQQAGEVVLEPTRICHSVRACGSESEPEPTPEPKSEAKPEPKFEPEPLVSLAPGPTESVSAFPHT